MIGKAAVMSDFFNGEEDILQKIIIMFELLNGTIISTVALFNKTFGEGKWKIDTGRLSRLAIDLPPFARKAGIQPCNINLWQPKFEDHR